jgi:hypothetical protein
MNRIDVRLSGRSLKNGEILPFTADFDDLSFNIPYQHDTLSTLIIYDTTAKYVHELLTNILPSENGDISDDDEDVVVDYTPPAPPPRSGIHSYVISLFEQDSEIEVKVANRRSLNYNEFIQREDLHLVDKFTFKVKSASSSLSVMKGSVSDRHPGKHAKEEYQGTGQAKWCSCVIDVAGKQTRDCLIHTKGGGRGEGKCYNPYAVCGRIPHDSKYCRDIYDYDTFSKKELIAYATLKGIEVSKPFNRDEIIEALINKSKR